mgnify:CR=1 FL=1
MDSLLNGSVLPCAVKTLLPITVCTAGVDWQNCIHASHLYTLHMFGFDHMPLLMSLARGMQLACGGVTRDLARWQSEHAFEWR